MRRTLVVVAALAVLGAGSLAGPGPAWADVVQAVTETFTPTPTDTATVTPTFTSTATPTETQTPLPVTDTPVPSGGTPAPILLDPLITKRSDLTQAVVGDLVTFTISVLNPNDAEVPGVSVGDPLPAQLDFVDGSTTAGTLSYDAGTRTATVLIGTLAPRQEVLITLRTRVNALGQPPDATTNLAFVSYTALSGQVTTSASSGAALQFVPSALPDSGFGPGPREWLSLIIPVGLAGLTALGLVGWLRARHR
jgi:uncharacterized repeat protein (TIGR01451 family)